MLNNKVELVQPNERVDSFLGGKLNIIQSPDYFNLSVDALLLADFIKLPKHTNFKYIDFCSGNGAVPLLLSQRTEAPLTGLEIQEPLVDMAQRSAIYNNLQDRLNFIQGDLKEFATASGEQYDLVSCNPPYFLVEDSNKVHSLSSHAIARHEITLKMEDWVYKASKIMKDKGKLFIVHRPNRLDDLMTTLLSYRFSINRLKFIHPKPNQDANGVLIEAIYGGGYHGTKVETPVVVHNEDNTYTDELKVLYYGS